MNKFQIKVEYFNKVHVHIVEANSKNHALNKLYSIIGSKNGLKRNQIKILEVSNYGQ